MSNRRIIEAFKAWAAEGRKLVLATVYETQGSTYSKAGQRIIIADNGDYQGLVSGGCLEGDLAEHAAEVIADGQARSLTYDLRDEADEVWGLGIGCNGLLRILLQSLNPANDYEPFRRIAACQQSGETAISAVVVDSDNPQLEIGATITKRADAVESWGLPNAMVKKISADCKNLQDCELKNIKTTIGTAQILFAPIPPLHRLLIMGAGPDALPVLRFAHELGWVVTLADHRPGYLSSVDFDLADRRVESAPVDLSKGLDLANFSAAIVMSHNLDADRDYLRQLATTAIPYLGLLGPKQRRARLIEELGEAGKQLEYRLHGPAGLEIGANSPESIALAIVAEMQRALG